MPEDISPERWRAFNDLSGRTFGKLTVLRRVPGPRCSVLYLCRCGCGCGNERIVHAHSLGKRKSCGCLNRQRLTKHGGSRTSEYLAWQSMRRRCNDPRVREYRHYGARGIRVCARWDHPGGFPAFLADMGPKPSPSLTLERKENDGDYTPENCKWATDREQGRNKRNNRLLTLNGEAAPLSAWAARLGIPENTIRNRLRRGWTDERTLTEAVHYNPFKGPKSKAS